MFILMHFSLFTCFSLLFSIFLLIFLQKTIHSFIRGIFCTHQRNRKLCHKQKEFLFRFIRSWKHVYIWIFCNNQFRKFIGCYFMNICMQHKTCSVTAVLLVRFQWRWQHAEWRKNDKIWQTNKLYRIYWSRTNNISSMHKKRLTWFRFVIVSSIRLWL